MDPLRLPVGSLLCFAVQVRHINCLICLPLFTFVCSWEVSTAVPHVQTEEWCWVSIYVDVTCDRMEEKWISFWAVLLHLDHWIFSLFVLSHV
jgi:hypothetical protein